MTEESGAGTAERQFGGTGQHDDVHWPWPFDAVIAVGSNIGDKAGHINEAVVRFGAHADVAVVVRSPIYKTPPWGITDQAWFANGCFTVTTTLSPHGLLDWCLEVEQQLGRVRAQKWGPRIIDLDVLVCRGAAIHDARLTLPHPHLTERGFVLVPMADVAPDIIVRGKTITQWRDRSDNQGIESLTQ
ncbi:MAG: 2-amino-4-hydroxy-6-hydroxymethyldihydropteridine diphosphokinase [Pseudomonadota bacterium]